MFTPRRSTGQRNSRKPKQITLAQGQRVRITSGPYQHSEAIVHKAGTKTAVVKLLERRVKTTRTKLKDEHGPVVFVPKETREEQFFRPNFVSVPVTNLKAKMTEVPTHTRGPARFDPLSRGFTRLLALRHQFKANPTEKLRLQIEKLERSLRSGKTR